MVQGNKAKARGRGRKRNPKFIQKPSQPIRQLLGSLMLKSFCLAVAALIVLGLSPRAAQSAVSVTLTPSVPSPQMLGTSVVWTATVVNPVAGHTYDYQFIVAFQQSIQIVQDSSPTNTFTWVPHTVEGAYIIAVKLRDTTSPTRIDYPYVGAFYQMMPWVTTAGGSAVNATSHPLVALFSGPPCTAGHFLLVRFHLASCNRIEHDQSCSLLDLQRQFLRGGNATDHTILDALGGIRPRFRGQHWS